MTKRRTSTSSQYKPDVYSHRLTVSCSALPRCTARFRNYLLRKQARCLFPLRHGGFEYLVEVEQQALPRSGSRQEAQVSTDDLRRSTGFYFANQRALLVGENNHPCLEPGYGEDTPDERRGVKVKIKREREAIWFVRPSFDHGCHETSHRLGHWQFHPRRKRHKWVSRPERIHRHGKQEPSVEASGNFPNQLATLTEYSPCVFFHLFTVLRRMHQRSRPWDRSATVSWAFSLE